MFELEINLFMNPSLIWLVYHKCLICTVIRFLCTWWSEHHWFLMYNVQLISCDKFVSLFNYFKYIFIFFWGYDQWLVLNSISITELNTSHHFCDKFNLIRYASIYLLLTNLLWIYYIYYSRSSFLFDYDRLYQTNR